MGSESTPPRIGASTGANPWIAIMSENARAAARPVARSGMMARAKTDPVPPAAPMMNRSPMSNPMEVANTAPSELRKKTTVPPTSSLRLPYESDSGPITSCPKAMPTMKALNVN